MLALPRLGGLQELELTEVVGPSPQQLEDALRAMPSLQLLHWQALSGGCKVPPLQALASLPRMRRLAVKQAARVQSLAGLTCLDRLAHLESLQLRGAEITDSVMRRLSALSALTQVCRRVWASAAVPCSC